MINRLIEILKTKKCEYLINEVKESSYELFFVHNELQMNRIKDVHHFKVTVYVKHNKMKGSASFEVHPTMNDDEISKAISDGIYAAKFVNNPSFKLAKPSNSSIIEMPKSNMSGKDYIELGVSIAEAILKADRHGGILNATEVFIYDRTVDVYNSNGVHYSRSNVHGEVEYITTQKGKNEEVELYNFKSISELDLNALTKEVEEALKNTKLRAKATPMPSIEKTDVIFREEEIKELIGFYLSQSNVGSIFSKQSMAKVGDRIQEANSPSDKITLIIDPLMKSSKSASFFDPNCFINKKTTIVENGEIKNLWGDNIFAQYLKVKSRVNSTNVIFKTGSLKQADLKDKNYLDIIKMSGIQVDSQTGSFGGEIRLAILHKDGKSYPVTGGSISGFLKDFVNTMRISNIKVTNDNYSGPKFIMFKDAQILGK